MHVVFKRLRDATHDGQRCRLEPRVSIYGRAEKEWDDLAGWFVRHKMLSLDASGGSDDRVRWAVQIPRLYQAFAGKPLTSFGHLMRNIFTPLFEVTIDPASHPELHLFLAHVGFISHRP
jgi:AMP deaminase